MKASPPKDLFDGSSAERRIWDRFASRVNAAQTFADAKTVASDGPKSSKPGSRFYSNLEFFLAHSMIPRGATLLKNRFSSNFTIGSRLAVE